MKNRKMKLILQIFGITALSLVGMLVAFILIQIINAPKLSEIDASPEGYLSTILDKDGTAMNTLYVTESNRIYVSLKNIPEDLQQAVVAIEDERFYDHH
jgi:penicillin-binding protein 1A